MRMRRKSNLEERLDNAGQRLLFIETSDFYTKPQSERVNMLNFDKVFNNDNPVHMEIGCGKATFAIEMAKLYPNINFLAVEKISNVIIEPIELCKELDLPNLAFLNCGAENLTCYIENNSIAVIYLNFSCPYPKNTYANRRLTYKYYLNIYKKILSNGGVIYQKTDNQAFFEYSIESFSQNGFKLKNISLDLHKSKFEGNIQTEYENYFASKGQPIYRLEAYID